MERSARIPGWFVLTFTVALAANLIAVYTTNTTVDLMRSLSEFARRVREADLVLLPTFRVFAFAVPSAVAMAYMWPIIAYFRRGCPAPAPLVVQRRAISTPLVLAGIGVAGWLAGIILFPIITLIRFGRWTPDLMSQHILSPLVSGFLASTVTYLMVDWVFRAMVAPRVFPAGRLTDVSRALTLSVRGRLVVFPIAVAFVPIFTLFGLVRAAAVRLEAGLPVEQVVPALAHASKVTFTVFLGLGIVLTLLLAGTITRPLACIVAVLRRVRAGQLDETVPVTSSDEFGVLQDGVNALVATLQERERILKTFGRILEPSVRDRLLAGSIELGGEVRTASVLFCDLRGFTTLAEHTPPRRARGDAQRVLHGHDGLGAGVRGLRRQVHRRCAPRRLRPLHGRHPHRPRRGCRQRHPLRARHARPLGAAERGPCCGRPALGAKVGIHTGEVIAGLIGARDRHEYTVIGDTVNVAARLQALCDEQGCDVLVSETTYRLAATRGAVGEVATSDAVSLRGREEPVRVYAIG